MAQEKVFITHDEVFKRVKAVSEVLPKRCRIWGVPRGGIPVAYSLCCNGERQHVNSISDADVVVDDILDSGQTISLLRNLNPQAKYFVLFDKRKDPWKGKWLVMPWEMTFFDGEGFEEEEGPKQAVRRILEYIGDDPNREGLRDTPSRVIRAWDEWSWGYRQNPKDILRCFEDGAKDIDQMVLVHGIPVISKCEHHLADIVGEADVAYIPNGKILGLSKVARLVEIFSRRLQVQERLTNQIAGALMDETLGASGAAVVITAEHACMSTRGVKIHGSKTTTSAMKGVFLEDPAARQEFFELCKRG